MEQITLPDTHFKSPACQRRPVVHIVSGLMAVALIGCAEPRITVTSDTESRREPVEFRSEDLDIRLIGALWPRSEGTLVRDTGWVEYLLEINNRGRMPLTVRNVKLLTSAGRYLDSASQYEEITEPPDAASELAEDIAVRSAGIAVGQVVPYGGTIVSILSGAVSVSESESEASAKREFALRKLKDVELAPGARVQGSAFLPRIQGPQALVVDWVRGSRSERVELSLKGYF